MRSIRALAVASEIYPIIKTGGLPDVVGALPVALNAEGIEVRTIGPGLPDVKQGLGMAEQVLYYPNLHEAIARAHPASWGELNIVRGASPHLYARLGNPYV